MINIEKEKPKKKGIYKVEGTLRYNNKPEPYYADGYWNGEEFVNIDRNDIKLRSIVGWENKKK